MKQRRLILIAVIAAALLGGPGLQTFIPSVGTAVAQEEEEVIQMKPRGKNKSQVSKPGSEKMSKKKQGAVVEEKQKKNTKKKKSKGKSKKKTKR